MIRTLKKLVLNLYLRGPKFSRFGDMTKHREVNEDIVVSKGVLGAFPSFKHHCRNRWFTEFLVRNRNINESQDLKALMPLHWKCWGIQAVGDDVGKGSWQRGQSSSYGLITVMRSPPTPPHTPLSF